MTLLDRYLRRGIVGATTLVLSVFVVLSGLIKFAEQLKFLGRGNYTIAQAGLYTLMSIPADISLFFPMAILLGVLLGLGAMVSHGEVGAMEALGMTRLRISLSVIKVVLPMSLVLLVAIEWLVPASEALAINSRARAMYGEQWCPTSGGLWVKRGNDFIYVGRIVSPYELADIYVYSFNSRLRLQAFHHAAKATFSEGAWSLKQLSSSSLVPDHGLKLRQSESCIWELGLVPDNLGLLSAKLTHLSISDLYLHMKYLRGSGRGSSHYALALWKNLLAPLSTGVMMLSGLAFIFGPLRQVSTGRRVMAGIVFGFTFYTLSEMLGNISLVYNISPILGAAAPSMLFLPPAIWILHKAR